MIHIQLNGQEKRVRRSITIEKILEEAQISHRAIAVAVNNEIVPRSDFQRIKVRNKDRLEIIRAVAGG